MAQATTNGKDGLLGSESLVPQDTAASSRAPSFRSTTGSVNSAIPSNIETPASSTTTTAGAERDEDDWKAPNGTLKTPILKPMAASARPSPPKLTPEQEAKYATVLASVSSWKTIPATSAKTAPQVELEDFERMWLTRECLLRYLRATKWNTANALKRLQATLSWRREYGADTFTADYISPENETGKQVQIGYDNNCRPCLYMNPAKQNTKASDRQIHFLCYMLDRAVDMMPPDVETSALIINFKGAGTSNTPTVKQAQAALNILQNHNPERLGKALISETPWYINTFFRLISPFIDPVTREKMKFNEDLRNFVPPEQLWKEHEGDLNFEYDHAVYWPAFTAECKKRRDAYRQRWEAAGSRIGEYEGYLKGGTQPSLQQILESAKEDGAADPEEEKDATQVAAGVARLTV